MRLIEMCIAVRKYNVFIRTGEKLCYLESVDFKINYWAKCQIAVGVLLEAGVAYSCHSYQTSKWEN